MSFIILGISFLLLLTSYLSLTVGTPLTQSSTNDLSVDRWTNLEVDDWLPKYIRERNIPIDNFLAEFPKAAGQPLDCSLTQACTTVHEIKRNASDDDVRIQLVLASLTHFNDLFRMINRWYSGSFYLEYSFRLHLVETFSTIYHDFTPEDLNATIPAADVSRIFFNLVWYVPDVLPNDALVRVVEKAVDKTADAGFNYAWKNLALREVSSDHSNIDWSMQSASDALVSLYHDVVSNKTDVSVLDFIKGGNMLRVQYARDLVKSGWRNQAQKMFHRQVLSLVLEANGVIVHRASYEGMEANDTAMDLDGTHDDPYTHVTYSPVHWGVQPDGNITRQYNLSENFQSLNIRPSNIYSQSWDCFKATNSEDFKTNYKKPWDLPGYPQPLYIENWDGTDDTFDSKNPLCTFNMPVNNQPADIKQSDFVNELKEACPQQFANVEWLDQVDYTVYRACMIASDAWVSTLVSTEGTDPELPSKLSDFCSAADDELFSFGKGIASTLWNGFKYNMIFGAIFNVHEAVKSIGDGINAIRSSIKGGWSPILKEGAPMIIDPPGPVVMLPARDGSVGEKQGAGDNTQDYNSQQAQAQSLADILNKGFDLTKAENDVEE